MSRLRDICKDEAKKTVFVMLSTFLSMLKYRPIFRIWKQNYVYFDLF